MGSQGYCVIATTGTVVVLVGTYETEGEALDRANALQEGSAGTTYTALPSRVVRGRASGD